MTEFSIIAVFLIGLLGGVHCLGLCGGSIVGMLTPQAAKPSSDAPFAARTMLAGARWPFHLAFNGGRLASYTAAGALAGSLGPSGLMWRDVAPAQHLLFGLSSFMLIAMGLHLAGILNMLRPVERAGSLFWRRIRPLARGLFPISTPVRAFLLGTLWGWLPCGLIYSVIITAMVSGDEQTGAMVMLTFGLGTLPNLLSAGLFWENIRRWAQSPRVLMSAGMLVTGFGLYGLLKVIYTVYTYGWMASCHTPA